MLENMLQMVHFELQILKCVESVSPCFPRPPTFFSFILSSSCQATVHNKSVNYHWHLQVGTLIWFPLLVFVSNTAVSCCWLASVFPSCFAWILIAELEFQDCDNVRSISCSNRRFFFVPFSCAALRFLGLDISHLLSPCLTREHNKPTNFHNRLQVSTLLWCCVTLLLVVASMTVVSRFSVCPSRFTWILVAKSDSKCGLFLDSSSIGNPRSAGCSIRFFFLGSLVTWFCFLFRVLLFCCCCAFAKRRVTLNRLEIQNEPRFWASVLSCVDNDSVD